MTAADLVMDAVEIQEARKERIVIDVDVTGDKAESRDNFKQTSL